MIKFNIFNKKETFIDKLSANNVSDEQISFIKDSKEIYTQGDYWGGLVCCRQFIL